MPNTREKLIELLSYVQYLGGLEEKIADHLIANGVTLATNNNVGDKMTPFRFEVDDVPEQDWKIVQAIRDFFDEIKQSTTNADLIRVMSDEELAEFISSCGCPNHARDCQQSCKDCVLKWLREPAGDDEDGKT